MSEHKPSNFIRQIIDKDLAAEEHVDIRYHNIIYNVIKEVTDAIVGLMSSTFEERTLGWADVRQVFHVPKIGAIAGCYVTEGKIERSQSVRLLRDGIVIYEGKIGSLRRFKDDVKEVQAGYECGIGIEHFNDIKVGDTIEVGTVVCIVEAMKLFNEIESEVAGKIVKVVTEDAQPVEYDQVLFLVDPKG